MLVFWDQRLVFLATPKTGSTAVETALDSLAAVAIQRPPVMKHMTFDSYSRFLALYLEKCSNGAPFTVIALMREPVSWLSSWYRFRQRDDIPVPANSTAGMSFDDFVRGYLQSPRPAFANVGSQARFLRPRAEHKIDHVFCYEQMDRFVDFLEARLDCSIELPRVNVSPERETPLSPAVEAALRSAHAADFALYERVRNGATLPAA